MKQLLLKIAYTATLALTITSVDGAMREIARTCSSIPSLAQPLVYQTVRTASTRAHHSVFARPTIDVAFKHMLNLESDRMVLISFLEAFTGRKISKVMSVSEALPALKRDADEKQTFLDLACREPDGHIFLAEVQVRKQNFWDARALYYLSGAYSRQLTPDQKWQHLQPVVGINILDHDTHTMEEGAFEKQFAFVDTLHIQRVQDKESTLDLNTKGRAILEWMSLYQVELPRVDLKRVHNPKKREWLKLFTEADKLSAIPKGTSEPVAEAYHRLEVSRWNGSLIEDYEKGRLDLSNYSIAFEEERIAGRAEGRAEGRLEGKAEGRLEGQIDLIKKLHHDGVLTEVQAAEQIKRLKNLLQ